MAIRKWLIRDFQHGCVKKEQPFPQRGHSLSRALVVSAVRRVRAGEPLLDAAVDFQGGGLLSGASLVAIVVDCLMVLPAPHFRIHIPQLLARQRAIQVC